MAEHRSFFERVSNHLFAMPLIAQVWAKVAAKRGRGYVDQGEAIPFAPLPAPLSACRIALITTGGLHTTTQQPFDMENPDGDASYRVIPGNADLAELTITHKYYDHRDADRDPDILLPLTHIHDLAQRGVIGDVAPRHFSFMGHIDGAQVDVLLQKTAPEVAAVLQADQVDVVLLTPA